MKVEIILSSNKLSSEEIEIVAKSIIKTKISNYIWLKLNVERLFSYIEPIEKEFKIKLSPYKLLTIVISNLKITRLVNTNTFIVEIDPSINVDGIKLVDLVDFITFGNIQTKGYPIIQDAFNYARDINIRI